VSCRKSRRSRSASPPSSDFPEPPHRSRLASILRPESGHHWPAPSMAARRPIGTCCCRLGGPCTTRYPAERRRAASSPRLRASKQRQMEDELESRTPASELVSCWILHAWIGSQRGSLEL